jgi:hypothetical protein
MPLTQATLTVSFTSNYKGIHRICWRVKDSGDEYDCSLLTSCSGNGAECSFEIPIMVDPLACGAPVIFEGYIQPICEDITSEDNRTPWEVGYYPEDCPDDPCLNSTPISCIIYEGDPILCGATVVINTGDDLGTIFTNLVDQFCEGSVTTTDIFCGPDLVVTTGSDLQTSLDSTVAYFCAELAARPTSNDYITNVTWDGSNLTFTNNGVGSLAFDGTIDLSALTANDNIYVVDGTITDPLRTVDINTGELLFTNGQTTIQGEFNTGSTYSLRVINSSNGELFAIEDGGIMHYGLNNNTQHYWNNSAQAANYEFNMNGQLYVSANRHSFGTTTAAPGAINLGENTPGVGMRIIWAGTNTAIRPEQSPSGSNASGYNGLSFNSSTNKFAFQVIGQAYNFMEIDQWDFKIRNTSNTDAVSGNVLVDAGSYNLEVSYYDGATQNRLIKLTGTADSTSGDYTYRTQLDSGSGLIDRLLIESKGSTIVRGIDALSTTDNFKVNNITDFNLFNIANKGDLTSTLVNTSEVTWEEIDYSYNGGTLFRDSGLFVIRGAAEHLPSDTDTTKLFIVRDTTLDTLNRPQNERLTIYSNGNFWSASFNSTTTHTDNLSSFDARHNVFNLRNGFNYQGDLQPDQGYTYFYAKGYGNSGGISGVIGIGMNEYHAGWDTTAKLNVGSFAFSSSQTQITGLHAQEGTDSFSINSGQSTDFTIIKASKQRGTLENIGSRARLLGLDVDVSGGTVDYRVAALFNGGDVGIGLNGIDVNADKRTTDPEARLHIKGVNSTDQNFALKVVDISDANILLARNDGRVSVNTTIDPTVRLRVDQPDAFGSGIVSTAVGGFAISGRASGAGTGVYGINQGSNFGQGVFGESSAPGTGSIGIRGKSVNGFGGSFGESRIGLNVRGNDDLSTGISMQVLNDSGSFTLVVRNDGSILMENLPTSSAGLPTGALWVDAGAGNIIKIV